MRTPVTIQTPRLLLREMAEEDYNALYAVLADSDIMRHYPYTFDEARVRNWISKNRRRYEVFGFGLWAVCLRDTEEMIGDCGCTMQSIHGFICPEIGYHIRGDCQRRGYARESTSAVRDYMFRSTPFGTLYAYMHADNLPSRATAASLGMTLREEFADEDGQLTAVYAVSREAWEGK